MPLHSACRVSPEKPADSLMGIPLYVIVVFQYFSLYFIFVSLITMFACVFFLGFILYGILCTSWTWVTISFLMLGKFLAIISLNIFFRPFPFLFNFWDLDNANVDVFNIAPEISYTVLLAFFFFPFFFFILVCEWFLSLCLPGHLFILLSQLFHYWFILVYFHFSYCAAHLFIS